MPEDEITSTNPGRRRRWAGAAALLASGAAVGGIVAGTTGASAATPEGTPAYGSQAPGETGERPAHGADGTAPGRSDEKAVTAAQEATLKAAALAAVPGATVDRVETDAGDAAYEVHLTKAGGTKVTAKFDESLKLVNVEDGMGNGDPQDGTGSGHGGRGGGMPPGGASGTGGYGAPSGSGYNT